MKTTAAWFGCVYIQQPIRLSDRRWWPQEKTVDDAEDRRVRADAQSQGQHCDRGEARVLEQHVQAVPQVPPKGMHLRFSFS